jgi:hypothetical protein
LLKAGTKDRKLDQKAGVDQSPREIKPKFQMTVKMLTKVCQILKQKAATPKDKKNVPSRELQNITTASKLDDHYVW